MKLSHIVVIALAASLAGLTQAQDAEDAEDAYRDARRALNRQQFAAAISGFEALRREYPDSRYVGDSYYWEAFALERAGELESAVAAVDTLLREHADAEALDDARALRIRICSELAQRGDGECAESISSTVRDPSLLDDATRMAAVNALLNMRPDRAVPIAAEVAANRSQAPAVRRQALFVLADKAAEAGAEARAREILGTIALDADDDAEVRAQAVFWLSNVPGEETLDVLAEIVNGPGDVELRRRAIFAISQHSTPQALAMLQTLAEDEALDLEVRKQAVFWIGNEGRDRALDFLTTLDTRVADTELRRQIIFAVSETGAPGSTDWLLAHAQDADEPVELRKQALFWAAQARVSVDRLSALYTSFDERELKDHLIWLIAEQGGADSLESLIEIARNDPDPQMRRKAVFWIGDSDDPRAGEFIMDLLEQ